MKVELTSNNNVGFGKKLRILQKKFWKNLKIQNKRVEGTTLCWQWFAGFDSVSNYSINPEYTNMMISDIIRMSKEDFIDLYDSQYYEEIMFLIK